MDKLRRSIETEMKTISIRLLEIIDFLAFGIAIKRE